MTKDEMVKVLRYKAENIKAHIHPQFFAEIADYLEAQEVDAISRKAVDTLVDELARAISDEKCHISRGRSVGEIMQDIIDLPSVTPKQKTGKPNRWIPVSEKLPEEHEWIGTKLFGTTKSNEVYVTFETPKGNRFTKHLSFQNGKLSMADQQTINAICKGSVPVAWMPLPEPYKAGSEKK